MGSLYFRAEKARLDFEEDRSSADGAEYCQPKIITIDTDRDDISLKFKTFLSSNILEETEELVLAFYEKLQNYSRNAACSKNSGRALYKP